MLTVSGVFFDADSESGCSQENFHCKSGQNGPFWPFQGQNSKIILSQFLCQILVENHENRLILCFLVILTTFWANRRRFVDNGQLRRHCDLPFNYAFVAQNCLVLAQKILKKIFFMIFGHIGHVSGQMAPFSSFGHNNGANSFLRNFRYDFHLCVTYQHKKQQKYHFTS